MTLPCSVDAADPRDLFEARVHEDAAGKLPYRLLQPLDYDKNQKYPLVIFLHGAGERGADNAAQLKHGMKDLVADELRKKHPCFVLAPQCPAGKRWVEVDWSASAHDTPDQPSDPLRQTLAVVGQLEKEFSFDARRIYITGLSMGGYGTWDALARWPGKFAAGAPVCGGGDVKAAERMKNTPIWAFHGDKDTAVKVERSRDMIAAIKKAGGAPKYTEYPGVGHDSWSATYRDAAFWDWLFAQQLPSSDK